MRAIAAGDRGYVGSVLVPLLCAVGHVVYRLGLDLPKGCDLGPAGENIEVGSALRTWDVTPGRLTGYDAVLCPPRYSNDPLGDLKPVWTST